MHILIVDLGTCSGCVSELPLYLSSKLCDKVYAVAHAQYNGLLPSSPVILKQSKNVSYKGEYVKAVITWLCAIYSNNPLQVKITIVTQTDKLACLKELDQSINFVHKADKLRNFLELGSIVQQKDTKDEQHGTSDGQSHFITIQESN